MRQPKPVDTLAPHLFVICLLFSIAVIVYLHKDDHLKDILLNEQTIHIFKSITEKKKTDQVNSSYSEKSRNYARNNYERSDNDLVNGLPVINPFNSDNFRYKSGTSSHGYKESSYDSFSFSNLKKKRKDRTDMNYRSAIPLFLSGLSSKNSNNSGGNLAVNSNYASISGTVRSGGNRALAGLLDPKNGDPIIIRGDELANPGDGDPVIIVDGNIPSESWILLLLALFHILLKKF